MYNFLLQVFAILIGAVFKVSYWQTKVIVGKLNIFFALDGDI